MFILGGYIFDKRLRYSFTVWTSWEGSSIVWLETLAGNPSSTSRSWQVTRVPGSRSLVNTFPYCTATDRSMADNFFRPGFTRRMGDWRTIEGTELSGVRRQQS